jgi:DNA-nicking Smr family endonuclease
MDYNETFKYFKKNAKRKDLFKEESSNKLNGMNANNSVYTGNYNKNEKFNTQFSVSENTSSSLPEILCKIISQNPNQWKIENNFKKINIGDYQMIRRKLIWQAQVAWRSGRHQDAKVIMAKARRYKQEINTLLCDKKIEVFLRNNEGNSVQNFLTNKENFIDLHGLSYEEAKLIINKKISDVKRAQNSGSLDPSRKFVLNIITGIGNHSKEHKAVLLPRLTALLKSMKLLTKVDWARGIIKLYL